VARYKGRVCIAGARSVQPRLQWTKRLIHTLLTGCPRRSAPSRGVVLVVPRRDLVAVADLPLPVLLSQYSR
jgi:hypothetical protein